MLATRRLSICHHTKRCMEETILYLAPIKPQRPQCLLQMSTSTGTTSFETQRIKLSNLPGSGQQGPRPREEHHALRYPLEDEYLSLETCSLQNQGDRGSWSHAGVDHSKCWVMTMLRRITQSRWTPECTVGERQYSTARLSNPTERTMMSGSQDEPISNQRQS